MQAIPPPSAKPSPSPTVDASAAPNVLHVPGSVLEAVVPSIVSGIFVVPSPRTTLRHLTQRSAIAMRAGGVSLLRLACLRHASEQ